MRRRVHLFLIAAMLLLPGRFARAENAPEPTISAGGAVLIEANGNRLLIGKNADGRLPMASTTKIMTALVALECAAVSDIVSVPAEAAGVEGSSMYLSAGENLTLSDLLYGLMLTSGNDAAVAIAVHVGGSVPAFIDLMNARAEALGCTDTHFVTPNGLHDENHYTTAHDLAVIASAAMRLPAFAEIVGTTYHQTSTGDHVRTLKNKNKTLWQYDGGCGVKTGYTRAAGKCLVFSAKREDTELIGVLLGAENMWETAFAMLDYGFDAVETETFLRAGTPVASVSVRDGQKRELAVAAKEDILYAVKRDGSDAVEIRLHLPQSVAAPVKEGQPLGTVTLYVNGAAVGACALAACETVEKKTFWDEIAGALQRFCA